MKWKSAISDRNNDYTLTKYFLLVFKKLWNVFYFAQYFSRDFAKYFACQIFCKMQLAFPQCTYIDEWLSSECVEK